MESVSIFPTVPTMQTVQGVIGEAAHYGDGNYVVIVDHTTKEEYISYLQCLETSGYQKYVDNGENLSGCVYNNIYTKEALTVSVIYIQRRQKTYISCCMNTLFSEHLIPPSVKPEYHNNEKTSLHMLEMWWFGNSLVIQLKNGHFVISDGGMACELPYLLEYMESLVPTDEKPIVEGWFFTHGHVDHVGVMGKFVDDPSYCRRIYVEGIYYSIPNDNVTQLDSGVRVTQSWIQGAKGLLMTTKGEHPNVYRPQTGQRYYFDDITIDILHTQEQLLFEEYSGDINDSSTWCMVNMDGQKCLLTGDGEKGCMKVIMQTYDQDYLNVDVMSLMHHGFNTEDAFTDYCKVKTLLLTTRDVLPVRKANENWHLRNSVKESFFWGDGTKVLNFPYQVGEYKTIQPRLWSYNEGQVRKGQPNVYRYTSAHKLKEIRFLRKVKSEFPEQQEMLLRGLKEHINLSYADDGMYIGLFVDKDLGNGERYQVLFDKMLGWKIIGSNIHGLNKGVQDFLDNITWSTTGFVPCETVGIICDRLC